VLSDGPWSEKSNIASALPRDMPLFVENLHVSDSTITPEIFGNLQSALAD
jgi:hypothetical protein